MLVEMEKISMKKILTFNKDKLRRERVKLEKKIAKTEDPFERNLLKLQKKAVEDLKALVQIAKTYVRSFGEEKALSVLPDPVSEEEIENFVSTKNKDEVWSELTRLKTERDSYQSKAYQRKRKMLKSKNKNNKDFREEALRLKYLYIHRRRTVTLFYFYILKSGLS